MFLFFLKEKIVLDGLVNYIKLGKIYELDILIIVNYVDVEVCFFKVY